MTASSRSSPPTPLPDHGRLRKAREWFERLQSDGAASLPPFVPSEIADESLSVRQRYAVARAVSTPDVCLIDTDEATGLKLALSIAHHASRRNERVLLVAPAQKIEELSRDLAILRQDDKFEREFEKLSRLTEAHRKGRWWTWSYWRCVFQPNRLQEYGRLFKDHMAMSGQNTECISLQANEDVNRDPRTWDRIIVCGAGDLDRSRLLAQCARADRWVFIGESFDEMPMEAITTIWRALSVDSWKREGDRLLCRIRQLSEAERRHLSSEPLSDSPDIELRIFQFDGAPPELAEVVFPPRMSLCAAKEFLVRDLEEWLVDLELEGIHWREDDTVIIAAADGMEITDQTTIDLDSGVREIVTHANGELSGGTTYGIAFNRAAGWDRSKAEAWLKQHCMARTRRTIKV